MGYCFSCGMLSELDGGLCEKCRKDFAVAHKHLHPVKLPDTITNRWILENAQRYNTTMARAFVRAVKYESSQRKSHGRVLSS